MLEISFLAKPAVLAGVLLGGGFFAVVLLKIVTGEISLAYLLFTRDAAGNWSYSPGRMQLLIFTVVVAGAYLHSVIVSPVRGSLPDIPANVLAVLGGSHATYLGSKAFTTFVQPLLKNLK
jgi:hypothetical protein